MRQRLIGSIAIGWLSVACAVSAQTDTVYKHDAGPNGIYYSFTGTSWAAAGAALPTGAGRVVVPIDAASFSSTVCPSNVTAPCVWSLSATHVAVNGVVMDPYNATDQIVLISAAAPPPPPPVAACPVGPSSQTFAAGMHAIQFCWQMQDTSGAPVTASGFSAVINGIDTPLAVSQTTASPDTDGYYTFLSAPVNFPAGTYNLSVKVTTVSLGASGSAVVQVISTGSVTVTPKAPTAPFVQ